MRYQQRRPKPSRLEVTRRYGGFVLIQTSNNGVNGCIALCWRVGGGAAAKSVLRPPTRLLIRAIAPWNKGSDYIKAT